MYVSVCEWVYVCGWVGEAPATLLHTVSVVINLYPTPPAGVRAHTHTRTQARTHAHGRCRSSDVAERNHLSDTCIFYCVRVPLGEAFKMCLGFCLVCTRTCGWLAESGPHEERYVCM